MPDAAYDPSTPIGKVRFYCSDTYAMPQVRDAGASAFVFTDAEITMLLTLHNGSVLQSAADCCEQLGLNEMLCGKVITTQDLATDTSKLMPQYLALAKSLRAKALAAGEDGTMPEDGILVTDVIGPEWPFRIAYAPNWPFPN